MLGNSLATSLFNGSGNFPYLPVITLKSVKRTYQLNIV